MALTWLATLALLSIYEPWWERLRLAVLGLRARLGKWSPWLAVLVLLMLS